MTVTRGQPVRILATRLPVENDLRHIATVRASAMSGSTYGRAGINANTVGLYGEAACHVWLREDQGYAVDPNYLESGSECDLTLLPARMQVEVKTSRLRWWKDHGAVLTGVQVANILRQDALLWCVTSPEMSTNAVWILGWVPAPDLGSRLEPVIVNSGAVSFSITELDDLAALAGWEAVNCGRFAQRDKFAMTAPSSPTHRCARGHDGQLAHCLPCWWSGLGGPERLYRVGRHLHARDCAEVPNPPPWFTDANSLLASAVCPMCLPDVLPNPS